MLEEITIEQVLLICTFVLHTVVGVVLWSRYQQLATTENSNQRRTTKETS